MADGGEMHIPSNTTSGNSDASAHPAHKASLENIPPLEQVESLMRSRANTPNPFSRQHTSLDLDDYFVSLVPGDSFERVPQT